jgi:hypothetical protein
MVARRKRWRLKIVDFDMCRSKAPFASKVFGFSGYCESNSADYKARGEKGSGKDFQRAIQNLHVFMIPCQGMNNQVMTEAKIETWVQALRKILWVVVACGVVGGGYVFFRHYQNSKVDDAFSALFHAQRMEDMAEKEAQTFKQNYYAAIQKWPAEKQSEYENKLKQVFTQYSGTPAADFAVLKLGRWYLEKPDPKAAIDLLKSEMAKKKVQQSQDKNLVKAMMAELLARAYESSEQWNESEALYQEIVKMERNPLKPLALMGLARAQRKTGKLDEAKLSYEKVYTDFPESQYASEARALRGFL